MTRKSHLFYQTRQTRPFLDYAKGVYMYADDGTRYIDGSSGAMVSNIGHSNPNVLAAMQDQMAKATFGYRLHFQTHPSEDLAAALAKRMPGDLNRAFFVSGGSEAVESAIKLARQYALAKGEGKRYKVISRFPSYHGCSLGALALTGYDPLAQPFAPMLEDMPKIDAPLSYLDRDNLTEEERGIKYAEKLRQKIEEEGPETIAAFIMEPVGGASIGAVVAPDSYYAHIKKICEEHGILLIYDEVMTGVGRTGKFSAAEHWGIVPDIVAMSKGLGSGYAPLGAMIARDEIVDAVLDDGGFLHGFTYAGNPLACSAGLAVLEEIDRLNLVENAANMGDYLKARLQNLAEAFPFIGDVRGKGLLLAAEFFDSETLEPYPADWKLFDDVVERAYDKGLIIYSRRTRGGAKGDHFLVCPPLIINKDGVDEIVDILRDVLLEMAQNWGLPYV